MQMLERNDKKKWAFLYKYGWVGTKGTVHIEDYYSSLDAKEEFVKKFLEKTGNKWGQKFKHLEGKY